MRRRRTARRPAEAERLHGRALAINAETRPRRALVLLDGEFRDPVPRGRPQSIVPDTALIVVDMLSAYDYEGADALAESVKENLPRIVELRNTAGERDDVMLVYVQDNYDSWNASRDDLVERAYQGKHPELVEPIAPVGRVALLQKGRHSIFYQTALDHLLRVEDVERVVLVGQVTEQCILYSALDAYLRGYQMVVPRDAVAHIDPELAGAALEMMERNMHADLAPAAEVFSAQASR